MALEEPGVDDHRIQVEGLTVTIPPDAEYALEPYGEATLDLSPYRRGEEAFHIRLGRRAWPY